MLWQEPEAPPAEAQAAAALVPAAAADVRTGPLWLWAGGGNLYDVEFAGGQGWLGGWNGSIGHSSDGGVHWAGQYAGVASIYGLAALDASTLWAVGNDLDGVIYHSSDGGATWAEQVRDMNWSFIEGQIAFVDANNGWAVGYAVDIAGRHGLILHTSDGGATWTRQTSGTTAQLYGVAFADSNHGWAVGQFKHFICTPTTPAPPGPRRPAGRRRRSTPSSPWIRIGPGWSVPTGSRAIWIPSCVPQTAA